jgi:hypothetical protein
MTGANALFYFLFRGVQPTWRGFLLASSRSKMTPIRPLKVRDEAARRSPRQIIL